MLARGTSPIIVLPVLLFMLCFFSYLLVMDHWAFVLLAFVFFLLSLLGLAFFRDPERAIGRGVVSAADGVVLAIRGTKKKVTISVFMNIHNVHVNRAVLGGKILWTRHKAGSHLPAFSKDSDRNERLVTYIRTPLGRVKIVQIAGTVARRIVPYIEKGDVIEKGQRIGIIRLGSRVDVTLPRSKIEVMVKKGDRVWAGTTTLAIERKDGSGSDEGDADSKGTGRTGKGRMKDNSK